MAVKDERHYTLSAKTLAEWLESQPNKWWSVDGDPLLTSVVDFPCPSDELATMIRRVGTDLLVQDGNPASNAHGQLIAKDGLEKLADTSNRRHRRIFRLSWANSHVDWLLLEDEAMVAT